MHAARTLAGHADDRYLPYLRARTDDLIDPDASASFFVAGLDATWEFGLFGKSTGAKRATRGQLDSADADIRAAQVSVVAEVVRNWIELRTAQKAGELCEVEEAYGVLDEIFGMLKADLFGLPAAVTRDLNVRRDIEKGVTDILNRTAAKLEARARTLRADGETALRPQA